MNAKRRKRIDQVIAKLGELETLATELAGLVEELQDEETEAFEGLPESLQTDEKREPLDALENAFGEFDSIESALTEIASYLETARG